jgi:hypothetical protein
MYDERRRQQGDRTHEQRRQRAGLVADGTKIAFVTFRDFSFQIYVMNADGSDQVPLTDPPGANANPHWGCIRTLPTCAEGAARRGPSISFRPVRSEGSPQLLPDSGSGGSHERGGNFGLLVDFLTSMQLISSQDAAELEDRVAPC